MIRALVALLALAVPVMAQHHHPAADMDAHDKFYSNWYMPDQPTKSCCSGRDCYSTEVRFRAGIWQAKRREDGKWLNVPANKVEQHRDNPDGRNHLCAPPPTATHYPPDTVFCFALGGGT